MHIIKINGDKVELRNANGNFVCNITDRAMSAHLNGSETMVVITKLDGKVELRKTNGNFVCNITDKAKDARFAGEDIAITKSDGKVELRKTNGNFIRTI